MSDDKAARRAIHWSKTRRLTFGVLVIWFIFALLLPWFARDLDSMTFIGFNLGYYIIVQGALIVFVLLIVGQNYLQDSIDDEFGTGS